MIHIKTGLLLFVVGFTVFSHAQLDEPSTDCSIIDELDVKDVVECFNEDCEQAFEEVKECLLERDYDKDEITKIWDCWHDDCQDE